ncbi:Rrf2 family transcriptional regulator [Aquabacterium sp. A7-Y]|uniref:RrF2 family transcriptional regulator n=1 Tax=Aquabacterium sp. A7-Y TaxID=1349605 RepID=UPI00223DD733|nr:Rrf2 family transcriptional regulator [Aquabacterium sp. A7-Y]MCW7537897.1 Rrf2 family transcriptional regulator [Aquabacterium sp. A7-Y]
MKLSTFTDYSLRVLLYLATRPQRRATIAEIGAAFAISEHHLTKVVHFLAKQGWLASVRGRGGGLTLGRPASDIVVGHVVRDTEGPIRPAECFDETRNHCCLAPVCQLRDVMGEAVAAFHAVLDRYTLQDLVGDRAALSQVLFPAGRAET